MDISETPIRNCSDAEEKSETIGNMWHACSYSFLGPSNLTLVVGNWQFEVHKDILESTSDYFSAMFSSRMMESTQDVITLNLIPPDTFKIVVEGLYSGRLRLDEENIFSVVEVAEMLQVSSTISCQYTDFLKGMKNPRYALEVMYLSESVNLVEIYQDFRRYCLAHFSEIRHSHSLLALTAAELCDYLSDKYLVVEDEIHVVEAVHQWCWKGDTQQPTSCHNKVKKIVSACICMSNVPGACDAVVEAVLKADHISHKDLKPWLDRRSRQEDVYMFWSLLTSTKAEGLVDVVKLNIETGQGVKVDSMTDVVKEPGFDLGSAVCARGVCVYLSGGGPTFGGVNWIRKIWKFDLSQSESRWEAIGDLAEIRRHHAMVNVGTKLYIFGGFGKFRVRNVKLQSFDIFSGEWQNLSAIPAHVIKPAATTHEQYIFYLERMIRVHCFNTACNVWTCLISVDEFPRRYSMTARPLALHNVNNKDGALLIVVDEKKIYKIPVLHVDEEAKDLYTLGEPVELKAAYGFQGSVIISGKLIIFFGSRTTEELMGGECENNLQTVKMFELGSDRLIDLPNVRNVRKALSFVALPHFPAVFEMGTSSQFDF